jgi:ABC-type antimicrobial peptide transport system permease subunit
MAVVQDFLRSVELQRRSSSTPLPARSQLVVSATATTNVPAAQKKVVSLLEAQGLKLADEANKPGAHSYRVLLPERNNFVSAQREQRKIGTGGTYFAALLLILLAFGTGGLQVLTTLTRWRDYGVLQAVGFSPGQILMVYGSQLLLVLASAILFAGLAILLSSRLAHSREVFATAAVLAVVATVVGSVPALLWPIRIRPAAMLKELQ